MNITVNRAVIEQAVEALDEIIKWYGARDKAEVLMAPHNQNPEIKQAIEVVHALRTALEQPEQEPVGWIDYIVKEAHEKYDLATSRAAFQAGAIFVQRLLNTSPEFICSTKLCRYKPDQEPIAWMDREGDLYKMPEIEGWAPPHTMLYSAPPQRKPLTDMYIADIYKKWDATPGVSMADFARAIEAAHGIKD